MTWKSFHSRGDILRSVITAANERRDASLPMDVAGVAEIFGDELSLLAALQLKWHTRLAGLIERELMAQPMDLEAGVRRAWGRAHDEMPGVRAVLDRYRAEPVDVAMSAVMRKATAKEHILLAVSAGLASVQDAAAVPVGARIEAAARIEHPMAQSSDIPATQPSLLQRIKAVMAA